MARFSKAVWKGPTPNQSTGEMVRPILGAVLHIEQGSESGTNSWFHNPGAQASAHFGNPQSGPLQQWVDTADKAWAEVSGNSRWISVEHEGFSGKAPTPTASQIENDAQLLAWLHTTEGVPLQITNSTSKPGLGWHGMGGASWGGHYDCPGDRILKQRKAIIKRAKQIAAHKEKNGPFGTLRPGNHGTKVRELQTALNATIKAGLRVDGDFGPATTTAVNGLKRHYGWKQDGIVGARVRRVLHLH